MYFGVKQVQVPVLTKSVNLGKLFNLSKLHFPHFKNLNYFLKSFWLELKEIMHVSDYHRPGINRCTTYFFKIYSGKVRDALA